MPSVCRNEIAGIKKRTQTEVKRVTATKVRTVRSLRVISLADKQTGKVEETLHTTDGHPFYVEGKGFTPAGRLCIGNSIVTRAGPSLVVHSVKVESHPEGVAVYNFTVVDDHTYFVGTANGGTWVHNSCGLLGSAEADLHHIFPQNWRRWFRARGIRIDRYAIELAEATHLRGVHGRGLPGGPNGELVSHWNDYWRDFINANPNATAHECYQFAGQLMDMFGLNGLPIVRYR